MLYAQPESAGYQPLLVKCYNSCRLLSISPGDKVYLEPAKGAVASLSSNLPHTGKPCEGDWFWKLVNRSMNQAITPSGRSCSAHPSFGDVSSCPKHSVMVRVSQKGRPQPIQKDLTAPGCILTTRLSPQDRNRLAPKQVSRQLQRPWLVCQGPTRCRSRALCVSEGLCWTNV